MRTFSLAAVAASLATVNAGTVIWDGRFNDLSTSADLNNWSWSNQVGPYQYYIHGSGAVTEYVNLSPSYKNPADSASKQGAKITLTNTAYWNGQTMRRTELIPQTSAAINKGKVWYHFSMMTSGTNYPSIYREHQINFFESHFTEMKSGWISGEAATSDPNLQWMVGGVSKWSTNFTAGVWHNVAYEIDFSANTVGFWHSTGSDPLVLTVSPVSASTSSNGADWHLGVLELPRSGYSDSNEDFYFSGVYVESGSLTTAIGSGGSSGGGSSSSVSSTAASTKSSTSAASSTTSKAPTTSTATSASATATACTAAKWAQCGGTNWTGCTVCDSGSTCTKSNEYYSQCL
ncbi:hypothetical protein N8I77_005767 [Diaporthe amygdali]|uniref:CBM1 domain-containing protein n=1 Tax=Phomopsis amygdali TaxID=1214568 RepID=A0AAD9W336_PHOAM|nr:hypothetical protein N8I77_005767 [Diaporthe amygdali]